MSGRGALVVSLGLTLLGSVDAAADSARCPEARPGHALAATAHRYPSAGRLRLDRMGPKAIPRPRGFVMPVDRPPLVATPGRLARESAAAMRDGLSRMRDEGMASRFRRAGFLVPLPPVTPTYYVTGMRSGLRVARPWVRTFVERLAGAFHRIAGHRLRVTSLTRTISVQLALRRTNPSAAPADGAVQSTHLTGAAVDLSKRELGDAEIAWLRAVLGRLRQMGLVHAVEEFGEPHFHVMVRRRYGGFTRRHGSAILPPGC